MVQVIVYMADNSDAYLQHLPKDSVQTEPLSEQIFPENTINVSG